MQIKKTTRRMWQINGWATYYRANNQRTISAFREWLAEKMGVSYYEMLELTDRIDFTEGLFRVVFVSTHEDVPIARHWERVMEYLGTIFPDLFYVNSFYNGCEYMTLACDLRAANLLNIIRQHYDRYPELELAEIIEEFDPDKYATLTDIPDVSLETIEHEMYLEAIANLSAHERKLVEAAEQVIEDVSEVIWESVRSHGYIDAGDIIEMAYYQDDDIDSPTWGEYVPRYTDFEYYADVSYKALWNCDIVNYTLYAKRWDKRDKHASVVMRTMELNKFSQRGLKKCQQFVKEYGLQGATLKRGE